MISKKALKEKWMETMLDRYDYGGALDQTIMTWINKLPDDEPDSGIPKDDKWYRYVTGKDLILVDANEYEKYKKYWDDTAKKPNQEELPEWEKEFDKLPSITNAVWGESQKMDDIKDFIRSEFKKMGMDIENEVSVRYADRIFKEIVFKIIDECLKKRGCM